MKFWLFALLLFLVGCGSESDVNINGLNSGDLSQTPDSLYDYLPDSIKENETLEEYSYGVFRTIKEIKSGKRDLYKKVFLTSDMIADSITVESPKSMEQTGKIYHFKNFMLVNEPNKGIHVFDNSDPSNPIGVSFIKIPYSSELAMRDSVLYVNCFDNLVALATSDFKSVTMAKGQKLFYNYEASSYCENEARKRAFDGLNSYYDYRIEGEQYYDEYYGGYIVMDYAVNSYTDSIVVDYVKVGSEDYCDTLYNYHYTYPDNYWDYGYAMDDEATLIDSVVVGNDTKSVTGTGGSMAKFTIQGDYLYVINQSDVQLFDISNPSDPAKWTKVVLSWDIETLYPFEDKIFVGSMSGMYILDTKEPGNPVLAGTISHVTSCDPVVADDKYAYVTLSTGRTCGGNVNQMEVIDISDIYSPELIKTYSMQNPKGLSLDGDILYVCDGSAGMKVYNVEDPESAKVISWVRDLNTYDVIASNGKVTLVCTDGVRVYDSEDPENLVELSFVPTN